MNKTPSTFHEKIIRGKQKNTSANLINQTKLPIQYSSTHSCAVQLITDSSPVWIFQQGSGRQTASRGHLAEGTSSRTRPRAAGTPATKSAFSFCENCIDLPINKWNSSAVAEWFAWVIFLKLLCTAHDCSTTKAGPAETPAALTWACWQQWQELHLCWDFIGTILQLKTEPIPTWTKFPSHRSKRKNYFMLRLIRCSIAEMDLNYHLKTPHDQTGLPKIQFVDFGGHQQLGGKKSHLT